MKKFILIIFFTFLVFATGCMSEKPNDIFSDNMSINQEENSLDEIEEETSTENDSNSSNSEISIEEKEDESSKEDLSQEDGLGWTGFF